MHTFNGQRSTPQVNATGVMPLIFASSILALPTALARYTDSPALGEVATLVS
jgi:protein transport protein SEC61 subunit alpha